VRQGNQGIFTGRTSINMRRILSVNARDLVPMAAAAQQIEQIHSSLPRLIA
jgi:hypothetical protein